MGKNCTLVVFVIIYLAGCSSASVSPAARIVGGMVTDVASTIFKRLWSLKPASKTAVPSRSTMKFESGYTVETVFDGSKLGIEPYSVEVSADGDILVLDSENSNIYKISIPLSRYGRPKMVVGSAEGYTGHVDGKLREARLNRPRGLAVDANGNVYIADTMNMAIRKISDSGVVTIAGAKVGRGGGHIDGPSEDARFSDDFDVVYIGSSCSLLVIDRGNQAIREIQLHEDDCSHPDPDNLHLGMAVLAAACFFGYMLAVLQRRITSIFWYNAGMQPPTTYQRPPDKSVRPPLIPNEDDYDKEVEGLFGSFGKLFAYTASSFVEIFGGFRKRAIHHQQQHPGRPTWPLQESFVIPCDDAPPTLDSREPVPRKGYPFMGKDVDDKARQFKQSQPYFGGWNNDYQQQPQPQLQHYHHHQKHHPSSPQTYYEQQNDETNEIVFGAVQEQDGRGEAMEIKAVDYGVNPVYSSQNIRPRSYNYMSYSYNGY